MIEVDWKPGPNRLRVFGCIGMPLVCGIFGCLANFQWQFPTLAYGLWGLGAGMAVLGGVWPQTVRGLYVLLNLMFWPVGVVVSFVFFAVVYFCVLTPIGLLLRLTGRDGLKQKWEPTAETYWMKHSPEEGMDSYFRQT